MSSNDYREKLRAMAQEERERMNDFILNEARRKEQKDLEPEPQPEPTPAPVVVEPVEAPKPKPEPVSVVVELPKPKPEPEPEPTKPKSKENKGDKKHSFNFIARGEIVDWLLYKRAKGYNCSSLIKRILAEYMAKDEGWIRHRSGGVEYEDDGGETR